MPDRIKLLQDHVVNQIAAGEVIQRPASVVKELLDNAIDSGATEIKVIIKDSGKALIQVNDNGCGMSVTDARMSFERHATSKIEKAEDLFQINTKGFRGEALASIAAVAQVEMRTRLANQDMGTKIEITNSKVIDQDVFSCLPGTQVLVKNLFYNTPARRKFLKADTVELRHIQEEFIQQALSYPEIHFSFAHNDNEIYFLPPTGLKQRIVAIYGKKYQDYLIPVQPEEGILEITGFIGKPEIAKRAKGEQLFFVNRRSIRSPYLFHAIRQAYEDIIPPDHQPFFILFLSIDPDKIDVNVHPTKKEIKFDDERLIYNFLKVSIRFALGTFSLSPQINFEHVSPGLDSVFNMKQEGNTLERPLHHTGSYASWTELSGASNSRQSASQSIYKEMVDANPMVGPIGDLVTEQHHFQAFQVHGSYIVLQTKSGITFIDQQLAHERILYEFFLKSIRTKETAIQKLLFPQTLHLNKLEAQMMRDLLPVINETGFELEEFGSDSFIIHGVPALIEGKFSEQDLLIKVLDQYKMHMEFDLSIEENISRSFAKTSAIKHGKILTKEEINQLIEQLFLCDMPYINPFGKKCLYAISLEDLVKKFS